MDHAHNNGNRNVSNYPLSAQNSSLKQPTTVSIFPYSKYFIPIDVYRFYRKSYFSQWNDEFFLLPRSTVSSMTVISDSYRFVRTLFAKTGSVRPTEADPQLALSVVPLLVGWESDKISWESSIGTCESDSVDAGSSLTGILGEISETKWRQFSIANR